MNKIRFGLCFVLLVLFSSCHTYLASYQAISLSKDNQRLGVQGAKGTVIFKVFTYERSVEVAREKATLDAIHAVLMKGVPNTNLPNPLLKDPAKALKQHALYFEQLFGDRQYILNQGVKINRRAASKGRCGSFVQFADDGAVDPQDVSKINGSTLKVGITVAVNYENLRKDLEAHKIEVNISQGFGW